MSDEEARSKYAQYIVSHRPQVEIVCEECGETFTARRSTANPARYCSVKCRTKAHRRKRAQEAEATTEANTDATSESKDGTSGDVG